MCSRCRSASPVRRLRIPHSGTDVWGGYVLLLASAIQIRGSCSHGLPRGKTRESQRDELFAVAATIGLRLLDFSQALGKGSSPLPLTPRKPERGADGCGVPSSSRARGSARWTRTSGGSSLFGTHALPPHRQVVRCYLLLGLTILGVCRSATRSCARTCCVALRRCRSACRAADGPAAGGA